MDQKTESPHYEGNALEKQISDSDVWDDDDPRMKKLLRKVDIRILIVLGFVYCISLLDRTNLGAAVIAGLGKTMRYDLGQRYTITVLAFFPTYIVFQVPATVLVKKIGPRWFLGTITVLWGLIMVSFGLVRKWDHLAALRVILGIFEAGLFPGSVFLLSTWYKRHEVAVRNATFFLIGLIAGGLGGILAYGLMQMQGLQGKEGWRWIFIMEGVLTIIIGLIAFVLIVDFPEKALNSWKFLNEKEASVMINRLELDRHDAHTPPFNALEYLKNALNIKIWAFALLFGCSTTISYATAFFFPIILREELHFSLAASQCLAAPCYAFAAILMWCESRISDRIKLRSPFIIFNAILSIIGISILGFTPIKGVRYFGCFLVIAGSNSNVPFTMTFQHNNIIGNWTRAFGSATLVGFGGIGGIVGSLVFQAKDSPKYHFGLYSCLFASVLSIIIVIILWLHFIRQNKRQAKGEIVICGVKGFKYTP